MKKDLYTFSKNVWFVKLFKWVYGTDPTKTFNTFCPLFWSLVATILLFPLILVVKIFGKSGTALLKNLESRKRDNLVKSKNSFIERCKKDMSDKEAYMLYDSKCWNKYKWDLYDIENGAVILDSIKDKNNRYAAYLREIKRERDLAEALRKEKFIEFKESKVFTIFAYVVSIIMFVGVLFGLYAFISSITFPPADWDYILEGLKIIGYTIGIFVVGVGLYRYILKPIGRWLECVQLPECKLCKLGLGKYIAAPFIFIGKGILIIGDMIYMTYKKACPRITWTNEESNK